MNTLTKRTILIGVLSLTIRVYSPVFAAEGTPIQIGKLDELLWSVVITVQKYSLPLMALVLAFLGAKLLLSGDDVSEKTLIKAWMTKLVLGGFIIFGASTIARALQTFLQ